jgi:uncharacterized protein (TIGR04222 family)
MRDERAIWTEEHRALWARIEAHPIGGGAAAEFLTRLQREQGPRFAPQEALREYRRFVFLACVVGHEVTPSKAVDAVWHLHLLHTRDYWQTFCPQVLRQDLHHEPSTGAIDAPQHREQYEQTRRHYARWFDTPSATWWPTRTDAPRPLAAAPPRPAMRIGALMAGIALPALVWAARPGDPLDWTGRDFLQLYLLLMLGAAVSGWALRSWLKRQTTPANRHVGSLSPLEAAFLAGGTSRAIDAAVADLHAQGKLRWDENARQLVRTDPNAPADTPADRVANVMLEGQQPMQALQAGAQALAPVMLDLERRGLWLSRDDRRRIGKIAALPALAVLAFGLLKVGIGVMRDKPVSFLVVLCVLTAIMALVLYFVRPGRSRLGDQEVARLASMYGARPSRSTAHSNPSQLAFAVALGGTAVLAGTALAAYHDTRLTQNSAGSGSDGSSWSTDSSRSDADSSSDSSSDSGGDSGGSGCGGCGGGGD